MAVEMMEMDHTYICLSTDTKPANPAYDLLYEVDTGIWYVHNGSAWVVFTGATGSPRDDLQASALGYSAQTMDLRHNATGALMVSGRAYYVSQVLRAGELVSNLHMSFSVGGASITLGKMGLYNAAGARLAISAEQGTAWESSGLKTAPMITPYLIPSTGLYYLACIAIGGTQPTANRGFSGTSFTAPSGLLPLGTESSLSDLPATATMLGSNSIGWWIGVS